MGHTITEDTIAMILRRTDRKVKERAEDYTPRVTGMERTRNVWFFEVGDYVVRMRAIPKSAKQKKIESMDVKVKCSCPSWRWNGPEHWAMEHDYLYGRPKGTADYPKVNDPKFRHAACKHVVAVFEYVKDKKMKVEAPRRLSEMLEQLSVVHDVVENPPTKRGDKKRKHVRLDPAFRDPHPGIQHKLQPPRGNSQHGPEQTIEGDETMTSMAALIERTEQTLTERGGADAQKVFNKVKTGDLVRSRGFDGVALVGTDTPKVITIVKEDDIKKPKSRGWTAQQIMVKDGKVVTRHTVKRGEHQAVDIKVKRAGAYSRDQVMAAAKMGESLEEGLPAGAKRTALAVMRNRHDEDGPKSYSEFSGDSEKRAVRSLAKMGYAEIVSDKPEEVSAGRGKTAKMRIVKARITKKGLGQMGEDVTEEYGSATARLDSGAPVGDTVNNWVVVDVDSGGTVGQGFGSRQEAEAFCRVNNLGLIPETQSTRMEKADPIMLSLKRDHPNIVWVMPPNR